MKISTTGIIAVILVMTAIAFAGCAGTSPASPAPGSSPPGGSAGAAAMVSGSQLLGAVPYNWVEYKVMAGSGNEKVIMYLKWTKEGKCSMRFEGLQKIEGMPTEMDCSATGTTTGGNQAQSNPNDIAPDVKLLRVGTETVTVPAGTFVADKYTATSGGVVATYWIATGKPLVKMEGSATGGTPTSMELSGLG